MSNDDFRFQLSVALPPSEQYAKGDMVNIRGMNLQEFTQNLQGFNQFLATEVARVANEVRAQYLVVERLGGQVQRQAEHQNAPQGAQNGAQAPNGGQGGYDPGNGSYVPQNGGQQYGQQQQQQPYQGQQQNQNQPPPNVGPAPQCVHGTKTFLERPNKGGKPGTWRAWACPANRNDPTQCELEFIRNR